jgi:hypothetical protein
MNTNRGRERGRQSTGLGAILLIAGVGWSLGFAGESLSGVRSDALSQQAFEKLLPILQELKPNDSLLSLEPYRKAYRDVPDTGRAPIVLMPGWISALSGDRLGGLSMLGGVTGRSGARLFGTHVFGYLLQERVLVPKFLVLTEATLISEAEYSRLHTEGTKGIGIVLAPGSKNKLLFRDLHVSGTRALSWVDESKGGPVTLEPARVEDAREWLFSQQSFQEMEDRLRSLTPGTDFWDVLARLGTFVTTADFGDHHTFSIKGYVASEQFPTQYLTRESGVYSIWPFGYDKKKRVMPQLVLVFKNDTLLRVSPITGKWSVIEYAGE